MLLTDVRRPARNGPDGELIPMAGQDRSLWQAIRSPKVSAYQRGVLAGRRPYEVQAAIAAIHDEAPVI